MCNIVDSLVFLFFTLQGYFYCFLNIESFSLWFFFVAIGILAQFFLKSIFLKEVQNIKLWVLSYIKLFDVTLDELICVLDQVFQKTEPRHQDEARRNGKQIHMHHNSQQRLCMCIKLWLKTDHWKKDGGQFYLQALPPISFLSLVKVCPGGRQLTHTAGFRHLSP